MATWYTTGTVSVTNGSTAVTGSGTAWVANTKPGEAFRGPDDRLYEIEAVVSDTSLTLADGYLGSSQSGQAYAILPVRGVLKQAYDALTSAIATMNGYIGTALAGRFGFGSASAPGVSFDGDADTGFYRADDNQLAAATGGARRFLLSNTAMDFNVPLTGVELEGTWYSRGLPRFERNDQYMMHLRNNNAGAGLKHWSVMIPDGTGALALQSLDDAETFVNQYVFDRDPGASAESPNSVINRIKGDERYIAKRGSNANGEYVRFADGTQICLSISFTVDIDVTAGAIWRSDSIVWTYPAAFVASPALMQGRQNHTTGYWTVPSVSSPTGADACAMAWQTMTSRVINLVAIGRWF